MENRTEAAIKDKRKHLAYSQDELAAEIGKVLSRVP